MIERLQRALERVEELSPEAQADLAALIEEQITPLAGEPSGPPTVTTGETHLPTRIRAALAAIGSARDLQDDDESAALDRIRHEIRISREYPGCRSCG